jgi:hypothetical protein
MTKAQNQKGHRQAHQRDVIQLKAKLVARIKVPRKRKMKKTYDNGALRVYDGYALLPSGVLQAFCLHQIC